jgi:tetratricopeptide (TPR) repeat protein
MLFLLVEPVSRAALVDRPRRQAYAELALQYVSEPAPVTLRLASWPPDDLRDAAAHPGCRGGHECQATAVLDLDTAALLFNSGRQEDALSLLDAGRELVERWFDVRFTASWHLAAGYLYQAHADHNRAFKHYAAVLERYPSDSAALLARATSLEVSAIPDGFGGIVVADRDAWPFLGVTGEGGDPAAYLPARLRDPDSHYHRRLLEWLTREYRQLSLVARDGGLEEARLRLGRVLEARGHHDEATMELKAATRSADPFVVGLAHLCLARIGTAAGDPVSEYRRAVEADPSLRQAWLGLSNALARQGDRSTAVQALAHVFAPQGDQQLSSWVAYHLGRGRAFPGALADLRTRVGAALRLPAR